MGLQETVDSLMKHTGLADKVAADVIAQRQAAWKDAAAKKRDAIAKFKAERARLQALLDESDRVQLAAQKTAEAATTTWIKHRATFTDVHAAMTAASAALD